MPVYSVSQVAQMIGVSPSTVRAYCKDSRLQKYLSAGAVPAAGAARQLTPDDVRMLRHAAAATRSGLTIDDMIRSLDAGELELEEETTPAPQIETSSTALVLVQQIAGQLQQLEDAHAREREQAQKIAELERELATVKTQLAERQRSFWQRLFMR